MGVLDIQADQSHAFTEDDIVVLRTLADHISLVISNAQLVRRLELRMESERQIYQQMERKDWATLVAAMAAPGLVRNQQGLTPAPTEVHPRMARALEQVTPVTDGAARAVRRAQGARRWGWWSADTSRGR
jgi:signal transduction protein with GAF and PtsI domain